MTVLWLRTLAIWLLIVLFVLVCVWSAFAHDSWISKGGFRNAQGEWCCGDNDCLMIPKNLVTMNGEGYVIVRNPHVGIGPGGVEVIPFAEAQKSPDGEFWRCHRPDGTRRCFFAPTPSM